MSEQAFDSGDSHYREMVENVIKSAPGHQADSPGCQAPPDEGAVDGQVNIAHTHEHVAATELGIPRVLESKSTKGSLKRCVESTGRPVIENGASKVRTLPSSFVKSNA